MSETANAPKTGEKVSAPNPASTIAQSSVVLPRIAIKFCTQCKWNLRAAYYAQELLQTFSLSIGEIALLPSTGGIFIITLYTAAPTPITSDNLTSSISTSAPAETPKQVHETLLWDRSRDIGFPETKELKSRVRNVIDPKRDLGHVDRSLNKNRNSDATNAGEEREKYDKKDGQDGREEDMGGEKKRGKEEDCKDC